MEVVAETLAQYGVLVGPEVKKSSPRSGDIQRCGPETLDGTTCLALIKGPRHLQQFGPSDPDIQGLGWCRDLSDKTLER